MRNEHIDLNDSRSTYNEDIDNLMYTRDVLLYLNILNAVKKNYLIILSVKDTPGFTMSDEIFNAVKKIGFTNITKDKWRTYIGVINRGDVLFDNSGDEIRTPLSYQNTISEINLTITSKAYKRGNISEIIINGEDYSMNSRGWNFVIFDYETNSVIDSSTYDGHAAVPTFYHRLSYMNKQYCEDHFFLKEKYKDDWISLSKKSLFSTRKVNYTEVNKGIIEPIIFKEYRGKGGVCDEKFNFIAGHIKFLNEGRVCSESYIPENAPEYVDETVIYGGNMYNHPGHIIIETAVEHMWLPLLHSDINYKIAITHTNMLPGDKLRFIKEFFELYNIPLTRLIVVETPTQFKKVIVPDQCQQLLKYTASYDYTIELKHAFEYIKLQANPAKIKKIYLTKSKTHKSNIVGEDFFVDFFSKKGFTIINPEDYTTKEVAELMRDVDEVVSMLGTNTHFAIFCRPDVKLTNLLRISSVNGKGQFLVNQVAEIKNVTYVDIASDFLHRNMAWGLNLVCVTQEFKDYVRKTYNEELSITPEESLKSVLYEYLKFFPEYYSKNDKFKHIKNQRMLTVLQNMSEIFLGQEFNTEELDLSTDEDKLRKKNDELAKNIKVLKDKISKLEIEKKCLGEGFDKKIDSSLIQLSALNDNIEKSNAMFQFQLGQYQEQIQQLLRQNQKLHAQVDCYEQSRSWKITKPLRSVMQFFKHLFGRKRHR